MPRCRVPFQFHKGAIRTNYPKVEGEMVNDFNSIKVRLEPAKDNGTEVSFRFQFHKGAIRTL